jgi:hypothetical protein
MRSASTLTTATANEGHYPERHNENRQTQYALSSRPVTDPSGNGLGRTGGGAARLRIVCHQNQGWAATGEGPLRVANSFFEIPDDEPASLGGQPPGQ